MMDDRIETAAEMQQNTEICCENGSEETTEVVERREWYQDISLEDTEAFISSSLQAAARNVIAIGYYLKHIRDNELFREAGYENIWDYAQGRYGFSRSTASRYMTRNDRFSKGGNSPILDAKYQDYNKSQLQEMLSLNDEQLEQVTPDMTVREIREIRQPKAIPYFEIDGQLEFETDFPDIVPRDDPDVIPPILPTTFTMDVSDLLEGVATSHTETAEEVQEPVLSAFGTPERVYPPDSLIATAGCEGDLHYCFSCAMECGIRQEERYCREAPLGNPFPCELLILGFSNLGEQCQFVNHDLAYHCAGSGEPDPCCKKCENPCEYICSRAMRELEQEKEQEPDPERDGCCYYRPEYKCGLKEEHKRVSGDGTRCAESCCWNCVKHGDCKMECVASENRGSAEAEEVNQVDPEDQQEMQTEEPEESSTSVREYSREILAQMIKGEEETLEMMRDYWRQNQPWTYTKHAMIVQAYKELMAVQDAREAAGEEDDDLEQPELPILRNNDQRKEWLETFHDWPVWFKVPEASEVYYRYDLPDGTSFVICEYQYWAAWREKYNYGLGPECAGTREYLLKPGYHYLYDCKVSRTEMIEKLKDIQKKG